jgi:hypothetical protein
MEDEEVGVKMEEDVGLKMEEEVGVKMEEDVGLKMEEEVEGATIAILFSITDDAISGSFAVRKSTLSFFMTQLSFAVILVISINSEVAEYEALGINLYFS